MKMDFRDFYKIAQKIVADHRAEYQGIYYMKGGLLGAASDAVGSVGDFFGDAVQKVIPHELLDAIPNEVKPVINGLRDIGQAGASIVGNYLLPGSSLITNPLASKKAQSYLNSPLGQVANIGSGLVGGGFGSETTGIPSAVDSGYGWTNAINGAGNLVSEGSNIGTMLSNGIDSINPFSGSGAGAGSGSAGSYTGSSPLGYGGDVLAGGGARGDMAAALGATSSPNLAVGGGASSFGGAGAGSIFANSGLGTALGSGFSLYSNEQAKKELEKSQGEALGLLNPYIKSGTAANSALAGKLASGELGGSFNPGDLTQDAGYRFNLEQGTKALDRKNAATGNFFSGAALKEAQDYGQGLADNTYNSAYDRWLKGQQNTYGMLSGQSNSGLGATNAGAGLVTDLGSAKAGSQIATSNIINQSLASLLAGNGRKYNNA